MLEPILLMLYVTPLAIIAARHGLIYYADDTQLYILSDLTIKTSNVMCNLETYIESVKRVYCSFQILIYFFKVGMCLIFQSDYLEHAKLER